ncbi:hypothetical protein PANT_10d00043 [Moesziomyces antarcticus T-34]|uniref:Uncharacterized protein n=1 Tax=Pseudozyma antarctica (strain T-34) TaxID=1151754 RepID=M9LPR2_PSEA3|nr:hypothetical protein PANT_10d00043 [Moesziomyces antarcticus T-34]
MAGPAPSNRTKTGSLAQARAPGRIGSPETQGGRIAATPDALRVSRAEPAAQRNKQSAQKVSATSPIVGARFGRNSHTLSTPAFVSLRSPLAGGIWGRRTPSCILVRPAPDGAEPKGGTTGVDASKFDGVTAPDDVRIRSMLKRDHARYLASRERLAGSTSFTAARSVPSHRQSGITQLTGHIDAPSSRRVDVVARPSSNSALRLRKCSGVKKELYLKPDESRANGASLPPRQYRWSYPIAKGLPMLSHKPASESRPHVSGPLPCGFGAGTLRRCQAWPGDRGHLFTLVDPCLGGL